MNNARAVSRQLFREAMKASTMANLLTLAQQYAQALETSTDPDDREDTAADLAAVADEIQYRTRR